jgi:hypothetical protein
MVQARAVTTPWILASGLAAGEHTEGLIYLVNAKDRTVQV